MWVVVAVVLLVLAAIAAALLLCRRLLMRKQPRAFGGDPDDDYSEVGGGMFRLKVSDPEYSQLLEGKKTVEARFDRRPFDGLKKGDPLIVVRARPRGDTSEYPGGRYKFHAEVTRVDRYPNLEALLKGEGVGKVYPGKTHAEALERFGVYLPPGASATDPVVAIELRQTEGPASSRSHSVPATAGPKKVARRKPAAGVAAGPAWPVAEDRLTSDEEEED